MHVDALKARLRAQPFRPFVLVTANGARFRVDHPEWVATAGGRTAVVVEPNERTHILDVALIVRADVDPPATVERPGDEPDAERPSA